MIEYVVTTKNAKGLREERAYTAENRSDLFKKLAADGIHAISVREGTLGKKPRKAVGGGVSPKGRVFIAAAVAVLIAGVAAWLMWPEAEKPVEVKKTVQKRNDRVVVDRVQVNNTNKIEKQNVDSSAKQREKWKQMGYPKNPWGQPIPKELEYKPQWKYTVEDYALIDSGYKKRHEAFLAEQSALPWRNACEVEIAQTLFARPEDAALFTPLPKNFTQQFLKSLENPIIISEDDSEEVVQQKKEMREVKIYLKELLDNGEDIVKIINEERASIAHLNGLRQSLQTELRELEKSAQSEEEIDAYVEAANRMLKEKGAGTIRLPISATRLRLRAKARLKNK